MNIFQTEYITKYFLKSLYQYSFTIATCNTAETKYYQFLKAILIKQAKQVIEVVFMSSWRNVCLVIWPIFLLGHLFFWN